MKRKPKPEVGLVNPRYQPSKAELEKDVRVNAQPEEVAKSVMRRVKIRHIPHPKKSE